MGEFLSIITNKIIKKMIISNTISYKIFLNKLYNLVLATKETNY